MAPKTCCLDTTALLSHYLDEVGAAEVQSILENDGARVVMASVSIAEFARRVHALGADPTGAREAALGYAELCDEVLAVDTAVATRAFELGAGLQRRLPLVDAFIAAAAQVSGACLVHRDPHFAEVTSLCQQTLGGQEEKHHDEP